MNSAQYNLKVQRTVVLTSIVLFVIKFIAFYLTQSVAIYTDALESTVNVIAGFIGWYSLYLSAKPRDVDHPYGHGKVEFVSASIEGAMVLLAGIMIIYEAINHFIKPEPVGALDTGMILIAVTAAINYAMGYVCIRDGKKNNSDALVASGKHLQSDTYSTLGILGGLVLLYFTKWQWVDSIVAAVFGGLIIYTGYGIVRKSMAGIMDEADNELLEEIILYLNSHRKANWVDLHNMRVIKYGSVLHIDCHFTLPWYFNLRQAHQELDEIKRLIKLKFGESVEMFVHTDGCLDFSCAICQKSDCDVRKNKFVKRIEWNSENVSSDNKHRL